MPDKIGALPAAQPEAYIPFAAALQMKILTPESVDPTSPQEAALQIRNGQMPPQAGLVDLGREIGAYDLVAAETRGSSLLMHPASKLAVDDETDAIKAGGLITFTLESGLVRTVALAVDEQRAQWMSERGSVLGRVSIIPFGLEIKEYEVADVSQDGLVTARRRMHYL